MYSGLYNLLSFFCFALTHVWELGFHTLFLVPVGSESYKETSQLKRMLRTGRHSKVAASVLTENIYAGPVSDHAQPKIREFSICLYTDSRKKSSEQENI